VCIAHTVAGESVLQTPSVSDDRELLMVMDLLSKCKRDCKVEVSCMICLFEKLSVLRIKIK
jgi:hypothetical protein